MEAIKEKIEKNERKIEDFGKQITDLMGKDPRPATFKEDRDYWNAEKEKLDAGNEKLRNQLAQMQEAAAIRAHEEAIRAHEEVIRAHDLEIEQEKTKQAAIQSGQGIEDVTYSESYRLMKVEMVAVETLFKVKKLTQEQSKKWEEVLKESRGRREVKHVQPMARDLFQALVGDKVVIDRNLSFGSEDRTADFGVFDADRNVKDPVNAKCAGEMKKPPKAEAVGDDVYSNFPTDDRGQALNYCRSLLKRYPHRPFAFTFLTDLEVVIIVKVTRDNTTTGFVFQESFPLVYDQGGAAALVSLLQLSKEHSGLNLPPISGWTYGSVLGSGATSVVIEVKEENSGQLGAFKFLRQIGEFFLHWF